MIAIRVDENGARLRLRNTSSVRASFADLERYSAHAPSERRILLEPSEVKDVPLAQGVVYLTTPNQVEYEVLAP